ncbi:MAG: RHS repeat-associated core domain-containing protein, partial [Terriglobales bacterium]
GRGTDTIIWNGRGQQTGGTFAGTSLSYQFDPAGFRRERTGGANSSWYAADGGFTGTGTSASPSSLTTTDVDGVGSGDLAHYSGPPTTSTPVTFAYYSGHGDLAADADASGTRTADFSYYPFGTVLSGSVPANATAERWTGLWDKELDTTSSLVQMGVRPYDATVGRFYSVDPVAGGSLNEYDFAGQDPVNNYDLAGTMDAVDCIYNGFWNPCGILSLWNARCFSPAGRLFPCPHVSSSNGLLTALGHVAKAAACLASPIVCSLTVPTNASWRKVFSEIEHAETCAEAQAIATGWALLVADDPLWWYTIPLAATAAYEVCAAPSP